MAEPRSRVQPSSSGETDAVAAMREHIAHLESELATAVGTLRERQAMAIHAVERAATALRSNDRAAARSAIADYHRDFDSVDDEAGVLQADIHVLRAILAECYAWLDAQR